MIIKQDMMFNRPQGIKLSKISTIKKIEKGHAQGTKSGVNMLHKSTEK